MKLTIQFAGLGFMALALTGCFDGSSSNSSQSQPPAMSVDFGTFVKGIRSFPSLRFGAGGLFGLGLACCALQPLWQLRAQFKAILMTMRCW